MTAFGFETFYLPLLMFAFTMSATPGPNNIMLTASGANFGFVRTIPHMLGISSGFFSLIALCALGLGALFTQYPPLQTALKVLGSAYLLYLAWRVATARPKVAGDAHAEARPLTFWQAAAFQYANPKAWVMAIGAVSTFTFTGERYAASAALVAVVSALVNLPSISLWAGCGVAIGRVLRSEAAWRAFNLTMGLLTASCVGLIVFR
jgi:threonine/homoserine/homoserine lactone efflux protein